MMRNEKGEMRIMFFEHFSFLISHFSFLIFNFSFFLSLPDVQELP